MQCNVMQCNAIPRANATINLAIINIGLDSMYEISTPCGFHVVVVRYIESRSLSFLGVDEDDDDDD